MESNRREGDFPRDRPECRQSRAAGEPISDWRILFNSIDEFDQAVFYSGNIGNRSPLADESIQPDDYRAYGPGSIEKPNEAVWLLEIATCLAIGIQAGCEMRLVRSDQFTKKTREIDCNMIHGHRTKVDDPRDSFIIEENVLLAKIPNARL